MRENCTYGSMRGRAYPITRGVPLYSTPFRLFLQALTLQAPPILISGISGHYINRDFYKVIVIEMQGG